VDIAGAVAGGSTVERPWYGAMGALKGVKGQAAAVRARYIPVCRYLNLK